MTLIVAGFEKDGTIIFCGDSLITTKANGSTVKLTSLFRKIIPLEIIVRVPEIDPSGKIINYIESLCQHRCMIAFAGSTLVSQHIINSIQGHLKQIKYTYDSGTYDYSEGCTKGAGYKLIMGCENNKSVEETYWNKDMFADPVKNANELINKNFLRNVFNHCIQKTMNEFYININEEFNPEWFASDFIVALSCYETKKNHLFTFKMEFNESEVNLIEQEININELAIIGISRYSEEINQAYQTQKATLSTSEILSQEITKAIIDNESIDLREIGDPVVLKKFNQHRELRDEQKHWRCNIPRENQ